VFCYRNFCQLASQQIVAMAKARFAGLLASLPHFLNYLFRMINIVLGRSKFTIEEKKTHKNRIFNNAVANYITETYDVRCNFLTVIANRKLVCTKIYSIPCVGKKNDRMGF
jgi:hypothetical protein